MAEFSQSAKNNHANDVSDRMLLLIERTSSSIKSMVCLFGFMVLSFGFRFAIAVDVMSTCSTTASKKIYGSAAPRPDHLRPIPALLRNGAFFI